MPTPNDKVRLDNDMSTTADSVVLLYIQQGQWILIVYHSKKLPQAVQKYGITELEMTSFVYNIHGFSQLLKNQYFEDWVDHKAIENL